MKHFLKFNMTCMTLYIYITPANMDSNCSSKKSRKLFLSLIKDELTLLAVLRVNTCFKLFFLFIILFIQSEYSDSLVLR